LEGELLEVLQHIGAQLFALIKLMLYQMHAPDVWESQLLFLIHVSSGMAFETYHDGLQRK